MTEPARNKSRLNRLAIVSGILGALWLAFDAMTLHLMQFSWDSVPTAMIFAVPLLACLTIALKWRRTGGILLIIYGLLWPVYYYIAINSFPNDLPLTYILRWSIRVPPSYIVPGILFLVSRFTHGANPPEKQSMPEMRISGMVRIGLGALISFIFALIFKVGFQPMLYSISAAILTFGGLSLLVFATLARPRLGGIIGVSYSISMLAYILINRFNGRTQVLESLKYQFIPSMLLLVGSVMVLSSAQWKRRPVLAITL